MTRDPENPDGFELPTAEDLAAEDAALRADPESAPLSASEVETLMARFHAANGASARRRSRRRHLPLLAALLGVVLLPAAWMSAKVVWPSGRNAPFELTYQDAILAATDPKRPDGQHDAAAGQIDEHVGYAIKELRKLPKDDAIAARAEQVLTGLAAIVAPDAPLPTEPPELLPSDFLPCLSTATDPAVQVADRVAALNRLERLMRAGLTAVVVCRNDTVTTPASRQLLTRFANRLHRELSGAPASTAPAQGTNGAQNPKVGSGTDAEAKATPDSATRSKSS